MLLTRFYTTRASNEGDHRWGGFVSVAQSGCVRGSGLRGPHGRAATTPGWWRSGATARRRAGASRRERRSTRGSLERLTAQQAKLQIHTQNLAQEAKAQRIRMAALEGELAEARRASLAKDQEQARRPAQIATQEGLFHEPHKERLAEKLAPREELVSGAFFQNPSKRIWIWPGETTR